MDRDKIIAKLQKLLALARGGVGGEKDNAESVLQKLLRKYEMTIEELEATTAEKITYWFTPKTKLERQLLIQCLFAYTAQYDGSYYKHPDDEDLFGIDLSRGDYVMLEYAYNIHKKSFADYLEDRNKLALNAYVQVNELFREDEEMPKDIPRPRMSAYEMLALSALMDGITPTPIFKGLENKC